MIEEVFHKAGLRLTRPRTLVWQMLAKNKQPQSAREVYQKLGTRADLASVYRSLRAFEKLGLVQREHIRGEDCFYIADKPHHHITCTDCGKSECVPCGHQFSIKNFTNVTHQLALTGVCARCA